MQKPNTLNEHKRATRLVTSFTILKYLKFAKISLNTYDFYSNYFKILKAAIKSWLTCLLRVLNQFKKCSKSTLFIRLNWGLGILLTQITDTQNEHKRATRISFILFIYFTGDIYWGGNFGVYFCVVMLGQNGNLFTVNWYLIQTQWKKFVNTRLSKTFSSPMHMPNKNAFECSKASLGFQSQIMSPRIVSKFRPVKILSATPTLTSHKAFFERGIFQEKKLVFWHWDVQHKVCGAHSS